MARATSYRFDTHDLLAEDRPATSATRSCPIGHIPTNCPRYLVGIGAHESFN